AVPPRTVNRFQQHMGFLGAIKFSSDGSLLATTGTDGKIFILDGVKFTTKATYTIAPHMGSTLDFSKDGKTLASATVNSGFAPVVLWGVTAKLPTIKPSGAAKSYRGPLLRIFASPKNENLSSLAIGDEGKILATPANKSILLWEMNSGKLI